MECVRAAVNAGADAVYMGGKRFGARAYAESAVSEEDELLSAIDYCHLHGVKVYMTVNTLLKDRELSELYDYMLPYVERGVDAAIVQDMGVLEFIRESFPRLPIHASTQMTVTGPYFAGLLKDMGAVRVVTARELSLEEIKTIKDRVDIEIEAFVHGALCYAYSGQCLMSSVIGGRSGNRGRCAGPCRLPYDVLDDRMRSIGKSGERYVLSLKDLNTLPYLAKMLYSGVCSMKIEGRVKSPLYVAGVTSVYRKYLDLAIKLFNEAGDSEPGLIPVEPEDMSILSEIYDRGGYTAGYLTEHNGRDMAALFEKPEKRFPDEEIIGRIRREYLETDRKIPLFAKLTAKKGERLSLKLKYDYRGLSCEETVFSDTSVEAAINRAISRDELSERISKLGNTCFYLKDTEIDSDDDIFIPVKQINEIRRAAADAITGRILESRSGNRGTAQGLH